MQLAEGTVGSYEIRGTLGAGAMGEVYRARDPKLERDVAIKILPEAFAQDRERLARFEREAKLLAVVNHPAIATIYGLEESNGTRFLVMELVEGETLAERIARSPRLDVSELLSIFRQIAEALEAAHEKGIVHRELKPANIKIAPDGSVKVLDFGLAKVYAGDEAHADASQSPTLSRGTALGSILGTPAYMSPEQARGREVDPRSDIWAFGCCLYEALTGATPFRGDTVSDTLAAVLRATPDWARLPEECPRAIRALLKHCLQKDAHNRLHHAADLRIGLSGDALESDAPLGVVSAPARRSVVPWVFTIVVAAAAGVLGGLSFRAAPEALAVTQFSIDTGADVVQANAGYRSVTISPDGRTIVYSTQSGGQIGPLFIRDLDGIEAKPIDGTDGATQPFFSPSGEWVGYRNQGSVWKKPLAGGRATELNAQALRGVHWADDGWIYFHKDEGIRRIRADGGAAEVVVRLDPTRGEKTIRYPWALPGGKAILFVSALSDISSYDEATIEALILGERGSESTDRGWNESYLRAQRTSDLRAQRRDPGGVLRCGSG